ncbi:cyclic-phosphate processing receiver domain-containing protein [Rufibacter sp. LB8]|uniref:cyclic-phosphate processing receiver domain-containing protein n=1 Tax=Rufibacter sp. LB8 TaxID=2777781 RepID=UPI00178C765D|nr:cyclic-phosphate processing receiver domain-containing protein [Rufibacter sp. LB8]
MGYKLFLDDIRNVDMVYKNLTNKDFKIVRSFEAFKTVIVQEGLPEFISFDNDLGVDTEGNIAPDGYAAVKWLVYESGLDLSKLKFYVHSANPVAAQQIQGLLDNYIKFLLEEKDFR